MSEFTAFLYLGFTHITDPKGLDHVLFLLALAAIYRHTEWRQLFWVATAFTVGHSLTLALAVMGVMSLPTSVIEFLIPVTIVLTVVENLVVSDRSRAPLKGRYRPILAAVFGLVHGAGFANYLRSLFLERLAVPLLGFNLGVEAGQIAVLLLAGIVFVLLDRLIARVGTPGELSPLRVRSVAVSAVVGVIALVWAAERAPW